MANPSSLPENSFLINWQLDGVSPPFQGTPATENDTVLNPVILESNGSLMSCTLGENGTRTPSFTILTSQADQTTTLQDFRRWPIVTVSHNSDRAIIKVPGYGFSRAAVDLLIPICDKSGYDLIFPHHEFLHLTGGQQCSQQLPDEIWWSGVFLVPSR